MGIIMKTAICALICLSAVGYAAEDEKVNEGQDFEHEFMQGMENGFFLRDQENAHKEYECADLRQNEKMKATMGQIISGLTLILSFVGNELITKMLGIIEFALNQMTTLGATVSDYPGSSYCSGLLFGIHGSRLLVGMAKKFLGMIDAMEKYGKRENAKMRGIPEELVAEKANYEADRMKKDEEFM